MAVKCTPKVKVLIVRLSVDFSHIFSFLYGQFKEENKRGKKMEGMEKIGEGQKNKGKKEGKRRGRRRRRNRKKEKKT